MGVKFIANALKKNKTMKEIVLSCACCLCCSELIVQFTWPGNNIGYEGARYLSAALEENGTPLSVWMDGMN